MSGFFAGDLTIGHTTLTSSSNHNGFLCLTDTSGNPVWVRQLVSGSVRELAISFTDNGLLLAGTYQEQMSIGLDVLNANNDWRSGFVVSFDTLGNVHWMKNIGGSQSDGIYRIREASSDFYLVSGFGYSQFLVDGYEFTNQSTNGQWNAFALLIDIEGTVQCMYPIPSTDESQVWVSHLSADTVWQVGLYQSDVTVGDTTFYCPMPCGASFFVAKTCMGCSELIRLDIPETTTPPTLHPNPASRSIRLQVSGHSSQPTGITITDMLGKTVLHQRTEYHENNIDISGLANGIYAVTASLQNGEVLRQRLVVQR